MLLNICRTPLNNNSMVPQMSVAPRLRNCALASSYWLSMGLKNAIHLNTLFASSVCGSKTHGRNRLNSRSEDSRERQRGLHCQPQSLFGCFKLPMSSDPIYYFSLAADLQHSHLTVGFNDNDTQQKH